MHAWSQELGPEREERVLKLERNTVVCFAFLVLLSSSISFSQASRVSQHGTLSPWKPNYLLPSYVPQKPKPRPRFLSLQSSCNFDASLSLSFRPQALRPSDPREPLFFFCYVMVFELAPPQEVYYYCISSPSPEFSSSGM